MFPWEIKNKRLKPKINRRKSENTLITDAMKFIVLIIKKFVKYTLLFLKQTEDMCFKYSFQVIKIRKAIKGQDKKIIWSWNSKVLAESY